MIQLLYSCNINTENRLLYNSIDKIKWPLATCGDGTGPYNETDGKHPSKFELYAHIDGAYQYEKEMKEHLQSCYYICNEKVRKIVEEVRLEKEAFIKRLFDSIVEDKKNGKITEPAFMEVLKTATDSNMFDFDKEFKESLKEWLRLEESWKGFDKNGGK